MDTHAVGLSSEIILIGFNIDSLVIKVMCINVVDLNNV